MRNTDTTVSQQAQAHGRPRARMRRLYLSALIICGLSAALGLQAWSVARSARALVGDLRSLEALARDPERLLADGDELIGPLRAHLAALRRDLGPLPTIARGLGWLPRYGGDLAAVAPALEAAERTLVAVESLSRAVGPLAPSLRERDLETAAGAQALVAQLDAARPLFEQAREDAAAAAQAWEEVAVERLSPGLGPRVAQARALALAMPGLAGLGLATIDTYRAVSPLLRYSDDEDALAGLFADESALLQDLARIAPALPLARTTAAQAREAWRGVPLEDIPERQRAQLRQLAALPDLYLAVIATAEAASVAGDALAPALTERDPTWPLGAAVAAGLRARHAQLIAARAPLDDAQAAWALVPVEQLPPELAVRIARIKPWLAAARDGLDLAAALPALLGSEGERAYLLLAQSEDELRPTGGFITSAGLLRLQGGQVAGLEMEDSGGLMPVRRASPYAPEPLGRYMGIYRWVFRDANWSPDFPTAARVASELYALDGRPTSPDVIAVDIIALRELLRALGPVTVAGEAAPISADTALAYIERQYNQHGSNNGRSIGPLSQAMVARLESGEVDLPALATAVRRLLEQRHIQIAIADPQIAADLARLGWDGAVRPGDRDFLMVVDANVGYSKANRSLRQELSYEVDLRDPTTPLATLTLTYTHTVPSTAGCAALDPALPPYEAMAVHCYGGYVRVLAPGASTLLRAENAPSPAEWSRLGIADDGRVTSGAGEAGTRVFATYFALPQGGQRAIVMRYSLPEAVVTAEGAGYRYRLRVQKQAGREPVPLQISLRLPPGATLTGERGSLETGEGGLPTLSLALAHDEDVDITFRLP